MWMEHRLALTNSSKKTKHHKRVNHFINKVWVPDIHFPNIVHLEKAKGFDGKNMRSLLIANFNNVYLVGFVDVLKVTLECKMDFENFTCMLGRYFSHQTFPTPTQKSCLGVRSRPGRPSSSPLSRTHCAKRLQIYRVMDGRTIGRLLKVYHNPCKLL